MNKNHVTLKLFEFTDSPTEISARLQLEPTKTALKGETYHVGSDHRRFKQIYECNFWEYRRTRTEQRFIGHLVEEFMVEIVEPRRDMLREIVTVCSAELSIVQYYFSGCNPGVHLSNNILDALGYIGADLDIDIYCLGEDGAGDA